MNRIIPRQQSLIAPEILNPFVHKLHLGYLDMIKIGVMSVTVAPLRLFMVGLCLVLAWPLAALCVLGRTPEEAKQPLSGWRNTLLRPVIVFLSRCVFFAGGFHHVKVKGKRAPVQEAPILAMAPHSSYMDALPVVFLDLTSTVAKSANGEVPVFGTLLAFTQPVLVQREDPNSRQNTIAEIQRRAKECGKWPQIIIFPEGTCTNRSCLISYKLGAFHPGVPVQPVCLRYPNKLDTVTWTWEGPGALAVLWLTLCQFNTSLEIEFLPVYRPSAEEIADPKLFAHNVREVMARALDVPVTDHTFDDCRLMEKARLLNLPMETGLVEFQKLHKKLGVSLDQMQTMLEKFSSIAMGTNNGQVSLHKFSKYLQLPESSALRDVFALYDRDGSGTIDFREYVIGLSLVSTPANTDSTISLAFQLFDSSHRGYISRDDLCLILHNAFNMTQVDVDNLFEEIDADKDGKITFEEFQSFANDRPEYAPLFVAFQTHQSENISSKPSVTVTKTNGTTLPTKNDQEHVKSE
ncbi:lysophosphatidylcholine acyltransferase 2-like isoform X1 [Dreissena polymorpha]|uniref:lysophosphatidylcholine acyltransferase 2-like isoform X1 n=1 Tax=Dreissena polymorpha TaxID=45954 RepID=UPI002264C34D|nr:lysophosphatidylcholine acyltransferase 2-like isoform X1 [Dreissena polymorpha]